MTPLFFLDFRKPNVIGGVLDLPEVRDDADRRIGEPAASLSALGSRFPHLTLLIHGFNVTRPEGIGSYREFRDRTDRFGALPTCFVGVLWPGDAPVFKALSYPFEEGPADKTAAALAACLADFVRARAASVVAHSLGCRVTMEALVRASGPTSVEQVVLMAGAIDGDALARSDRYRSGVARARRVVVVSSTADHVLKWAFPVGDFVASLLHGGYTRTALGRFGAAASKTEGVPDTVVEVTVGDHSIDHGDYIPADRRLPAEGVAGVAVDALTGAARPTFHRPLPALPLPPTK